MLVRGHVQETALALNSLQGLYDGIVIAVDDRPDSDEVFEVLQHYPNMNAYRQNFDDFGRYDLARQDCLNRVPKGIDFVGWSDSDEVLVTDPYKVRQWLSESRPEAVNCGIHYVYPIGGHVAGQTYRNGRVRIWKAGTRLWTRSCHEYPAPINGIDEPVIGDVIFNHIKEDPTEYRADHHIELMQKEIDGGNVGWRYFQAKEYEIKGDIVGAINTYYEFLKSDPENYFDEAVAKMSEMSFNIKDYEGLIQKLLEVKERPTVLEYLAIASYWKGNHFIANTFHERAKLADPENNYPHFRQNDVYFTSDIGK